MILCTTWRPAAAKSNPSPSARRSSKNWAASMQSHIRNDENVVAFKQLQETVQYVLKAIGYKEIIPYFAPAPPPISISLVDIAHQAGSGYELAFFDLLEKRLNGLIETGVDNLQLCSLQPCVKHLRCTRVWTRACDALREEIVCFIRERLPSTTSERLKCSLQ